ncbi:hypothetical protein AC625_00025 [Peribacillus loiseleuriae]|uniref:Uncharacterized protein n=1 Tax=Peribacillus loiseleuriae TaxID=1679170 RepID=A0A0K9GN79_9BACI|nr:hypothetical protein AC625_00025 [Peribacillus loiseleuriae]
MNPSWSKVWNPDNLGSNYFRLMPLSYEWKVQLCLQLGWQRGLTLVPFIGTGVFCVPGTNCNQNEGGM